MKCYQETQYLYVILPYFNFCGYSSRRKLFLEFLSRLTSSKVRVVVVECMSKCPLGILPTVYKHIKLESSTHLWIKESLINISVNKLPKDWKYMAWIDADITFLNSSWVEDTMDELDSNDVVQLFQTCVNLGPRGEVIKTDKGFAYMNISSGTPYTSNDTYGFWHPGYAWACTNKAYRNMDGLIDWAILGSADRHMALAWIGKVEISGPGTMHQNYKNMLQEYQARTRRLRMSYVNGTIVHIWHGSLENRKYKERWNILIDGQFDPLEDIGKNKYGLVQLTETGKRLEKSLKGYFLGRKEDDV